MTIREVSFADADGVRSLFRAARWSAPTAADWERMWIRNPALATGRPTPARGWVLDEGGVITGFLGNLPQLYSWRGTVLLAAVAVSFVVSPGHRGMALQLLARFARQPGVDLLLGTTATPQAARLLRFLEFTALPSAEAGCSRYWIIRPRRFVSAALRKKGTNATAAAAGGVILSPLLAFADRASGHLPGGPVGGRGAAVEVDVAGAGEIGAEFDDFWERKRAEAMTVLAVRSREVLRHRFGESPRGVRFLRAWDGNRLAGYAVLARADNDDIGLKRLLLVDLVVERDDVDLAAALLAAAVREARRDGSHVLEANSYSAPSLALVDAGKPRVRPREGWPFLYKASDRALHAALGAADWYATLFDGDRC